MLAPTNFTLFSLFFEFLQVFRQLVYIRIGQGIGFCQSRHETAGAAVEKTLPHAFALGGQVFTAGQGCGVKVPPPLLFAGDAALFLQPGQQGQQRCAGAGRAGQRRFQLGGGQRRVGILQGVHDFQLCVGQAFDFGHGMSPF